MAQSKRIYLILGDSSSLAKNLIEHFEKENVAFIGISRNSPSIQADLTKSKQTSKAAQVISQKFNKLDGVINFVGGQLGEGKIADISEDQWLDTFRLNVLSFSNSFNSFSTLLNQDSLWINLSSVMTRSPSVFNSHYAATKAALETLTRSVALDYEQHRIRLLTLRVGAIDTEKTRENSHFDEERVKSRITMNRMGKMNELSTFIHFLLESQAKWVTGHVYDFDGGTALR